MLKGETTVDGTFTSYYSNDSVQIQIQGAITNTYELDATLRQHLRTRTGGSEPGTEVYHYAGGSDSPAWIGRSTSWSRNIAGIDGGLVAIQDSAKGTTLQLTNLHGDIVATASTNPEATKLLANFEFDEFGNPKQSGGSKYGWLGAMSRRTELPSGVVQMGVRSYVPAMGRFTSVDPVQGGSVNAYDYANADPVNGLDLSGRVTGCNLTTSVYSRRHRLYTHSVYRCPTSAWPTGHSLLKVTVKFERHTQGVLDEIFKGQYETLAVASFKPDNPSDPRWRNFLLDEIYYCGYLDREYQYVIILNVIYQSPTGVGGGSRYETLEARDQATCQR